VKDFLGGRAGAECHGANDISSTPHGFNLLDLDLDFYFDQSSVSWVQRNVIRSIHRAIRTAFRGLPTVFWRD